RDPRVPLSYRIPPTAPPPEPAEVPRRSGDWRGQLSQRHLAGREGGGAPCGRRAALRVPIVIAAHPLLAAVQALHRRIRRDVVAACEQAAVSALSTVAREDEGDTIYAIDRVAE